MSKPAQNPAFKERSSPDRVTDTPVLDQIGHPRQVVRDDLQPACIFPIELESGMHGLEDGSRPGDWRLPTKSEWEDLFDTRYSYPALSNTAGDGQWTDGNPFFYDSYYHPLFWSQTFYSPMNVIYIAYVSLGEMKQYPFYQYRFLVWPVREDQ